MPFWASSMPESERAVSRPHSEPQRPTLKQGNGSMKFILAMIPLWLVISCGSAVSNRAICVGTDASRTAAAAALAEDGGDRSVLAGALLIQQIDAACMKSP